MPNNMSIRLTPGKADFIKRVNPVTKITDNVCLLEWNVDLSRGCIAQVSSKHFDEIVENNGKYAPGNYAVYKKQGTADGRCDYCYAWGKNSGAVNPAVVDDKTRADFLEHKPRILRFGKNTEPGHPYYSKPFFDLLELCKEFRTTPIITTRMLPFGLEGAIETQNYSENHDDSIARYARKINFPSGEVLATMLRDVRTSLLVSLGYDNIETGPVSQGFSNEWRIVQANRFHASKVNTSLTVVCDVTSSIADNISRGSFIGRALEEKAKTGINVRVIPPRIYTHKSAVAITGSRRSVINSPGYHQTLTLEGIDNAEPLPTSRYRAAGMLKSVSNYLHPDFRKLMVEGMGVCGAIGENEHCDKCNTCGGKMRVTFPVSELPKIEFTNPTRRQQMVRRNKNKLTKGIALLPGFKDQFKKSFKPAAVE